MSEPSEVKVVRIEQGACEASVTLANGEEVVVFGATRQEAMERLVRKVAKLVVVGI